MRSTVDTSKIGQTGYPLRERRLAAGASGGHEYSYKNNSRRDPGRILKK
jgi:hypothetical protein